MFLRTLLDRYIFTELLSPFSISLGALCFVMLTRELLRLVELLVSKGVGIVAVLEVFAHLMPSFLVLPSRSPGSSPRSPRSDGCPSTRNWWRCRLRA